MSSLLSWEPSAPGLEAEFRKLQRAAISLIQLGLGTGYRAGLVVFIHRYTQTFLDPE